MKGHFDDKTNTKKGMNGEKLKKIEMDCDMHMWF